MSNKRIDLGRTSFSSSADIKTVPTNFSEYETLVWCELGEMEKLPNFAFLGDKAYEYVIENPQKIAERISGNYRFDVSLIEKIAEEKECLPF